MKGLYYTYKVQSWVFKNYLHVFTPYYKCLDHLLPIIFTIIHRDNYAFISNMIHGFGFICMLLSKTSDAFCIKIINSLEHGIVYFIYFFSLNVNNSITELNCTQENKTKKGIYDSDNPIPI